MEKAGIDYIPSTPDELYTALVALKNIGVEIPLCIRKDHISRVLAPGFDSWDDFYVEDGVVKKVFTDFLPEYEQKRVSCICKQALFRRSLG